MRRKLQFAAIVFGLVVLAVGLAAAPFFLAIGVATGPGQVAMTVLMLGAAAGAVAALGAVLAWAGWQGVQGRPSRELRLPSFVVLGAVFFGVVALGAVLAQSAVGWLALPMLHAAAALLPALAVVALVVHPLRQARVVFTARDLAVQFTFGSLVATAAAGALQVMALIGMGVGAAAVLAAAPGGRQAVAELSAMVQAPTFLTEPQTMLDALLTPPVLLAVGLFVVVLVPAVEETCKSLGVALTGASRGRLSAAQAFGLGVMAGAGFAFVEGMGGTAIVAPAAWASTVALRGGTAAVHGLATGLMGLGWQALLMRGRPWTFLGLSAAAMALHGTWNLLAATSALREAAAGSDSPMLVPALMGMLVIATTTLYLLSRRLARDEESQPPALAMPVASLRSR